MQEQFTVDMLRTIAGAASATFLVTEFVKNAFGLEGRLCNILALVVAEIITIGMSVDAGCLTVSCVLVAILNGVVVCATSMGIYKGLNLKKNE